MYGQSKRVAKEKTRVEGVSKEHQTDLRPTNVTIDPLQSCIKIHDLSLNDHKVWASHGWETMIECASSIEPGVLRDLKSVLTAYAREARNPDDILYNLIHFIPLVSTPWDNHALQTLVDTWARDVLRVEIPLNNHFSESKWRRLCKCALAQLTLKDLWSVGAEFVQERTKRVRKSKFHITKSSLLV